MHITLIILSGIIAVQSGCPRKCNCTYNSVICTSKYLNYVPYFNNLDNTPAIIDLSGNNIAAIETNDFSIDKSNEIKEIYINNSNLNSIEENAFSHLSNLQELYLQGNLLNYLPENVITSNPLIILDLSENYFTHFPKLKSHTLEVLILVNSGVATIDNDSLVDLTRLKMLFLQQNNLKYIDSAVFDTVKAFFFIKLTLNPWKCDCETVKLFHYLTAKNYMEINETIQCQRENRSFADFYNEKGVIAQFENQCRNSKIYEDVIKDENGYFEMKKMFEQVQSDNLKSTVKDNSYEINFYYLVLLLIAFPLCFLVGVLLGSLLTYRNTILQLKRKNECNKALLASKFEA